MPLRCAVIEKEVSPELDYSRAVDAIMRLIELVRPYSWLITPILGFVIGQAIKKAHAWWTTDTKANQPERRSSVEVITRPPVPTGTLSARQIKEDQRRVNRDKWARRVLGFFGVILSAFALLDLLLFGLLIVSRPDSYQSVSQIGNLILGGYFFWEYWRRRQQGRRAEAQQAAQLQPALSADQLPSADERTSGFVLEGWKIRARKRDIKDRCIETFQDYILNTR